MDALENQLKEARFLAEEADKKYDEVLKPDNTWLIVFVFYLTANHNIIILNYTTQNNVLNI